ncbi:MAG: hypothetical protein R3D67_00375 [Hyphomicrobiaceae bacterium]
MSLNTPRSTGTTTKEEQEKKLKTFMLEQAGTSPAETTDALAVLAQSPSSPVVRALLALSDDLAKRGLGAKIILTGGALAARDETWNLVFSSRFVHEIRLTTNPRILDGHEQLVIADRALWFGDCMRRDPAKIDGFEKFSANSPVEARSARTTFTRLWQSAQPVYTSAAIASISVDRLTAARRNADYDAAERARSLLTAASNASGQHTMGNTQDLLETLRVWRPSTRH